MGRTNHGGVDAKIRAGLLHAVLWCIEPGDTANVTTVTIFFWSCAKTGQESRRPRQRQRLEELQRFASSSRLKDAIQAESQSISARTCHLPGELA